MADVQKNFASIVALGSQNPQILNVDFLKINKIIPADQTPFEKCTKFVSTPPFVIIGFGPIEILVEEQRLQIREASLSDWNTSIFNIILNYYKVLKYTPVKTFGLNLICKIGFENVEESEAFQKLLLPEKSKIVEIIAEDRFFEPLAFNINLKHSIKVEVASIVQVNESRTSTKKKVVPGIRASATLTSAPARVRKTSKKKQSSG